MGFDFPKLNFKSVASTILLIIALVAIFNSVTVLDASQVMVVQNLFTGNLAWYDTPGPKIFLGKNTKYHLQRQFSFSAKPDQGKAVDESLRVRFNDGAHGFLSGVINYEFPRSDENRTKLHRRFGSESGLEEQLIRPILEKTIYMTGPLMSSKESNAEKRNILLQYIEDQVTNGVYQTTTRQEKQPDPMTGVLKTVGVVDIVKEPNGLYARTDASPLKEFGIRTYNLVINGITYDKTVEAQFKNQQESLMGVQTAIAEAKKAEQSAITAEKNGQAQAAKAKWDQEVIKAKFVTEAEQKLEVAKLEAKAAAENKRKLTLEGEGEAAKRRLIMAADGGLDKKLDALKEINKTWAEAIRDYKGDWVPQIQMGANGSGGGQSMDLMRLLTAKTAMDLGVDVKAGGLNRTRTAR